MGHGAAVSSLTSPENQCWFLQTRTTNRTLCFCYLIHLITCGIRAIRGKTLVLGAGEAAHCSPMAHSPETRPPLSGKRNDLAPPHITSVVTLRPNEHFFSMGGTQAWNTLAMFVSESIKEEVGPIVGQRIWCITCMYLQTNTFGSECCLLRQRGRPLACRRLPILPESFVGGASTGLRENCSEIACLLPGSVCPAHALLSARHFRVKRHLGERPPWWFM